MFKFMKSKKGFTLVELMIVVVIMAILVAVAVPIYSAVTNNARKKTCAANRREIVSQLNGYYMGNNTGTPIYDATGSIVLKTNDDGDGIDTANSSVAATTKFADVDAFAALFQKLPYCPTAGNTVTITVSTGTADSTSTVEVECSEHGV